MMLLEREQELNSLSQEILIDCETLSMQSSMSQSIEQDSMMIMNGKNEFTKPKIVVPSQKSPSMTNQKSPSVAGESKIVRGQKKSLPKAQQLSLAHALQAPKLAVRSTKTTELRARRSSAASTGSAESFEKLQMASPPKNDQKSRSSSPKMNGALNSKDATAFKKSPVQTTGKASGNF